MTNRIHKTAIIGDKSNLGENIEVGPYAIIENGSTIGDNCVINSHSVIKKGVRLGCFSKVGHFSVLGGDPQHLDFDPHCPSYLEIGENCRFGEGVTVHRSMFLEKSTVIHEGAFLMGNSHVGHDCIMGQNSILANGVLLGGHVEVGSDVFVGGGAGIHQFVRLGNGCMIGGYAEITLDVGPQLLVIGRNQLLGLNKVGLKRRKCEDFELSKLKKLFRSLFKSPGNISTKAKNLLEEAEFNKLDITRDFLKFFLVSKRGFAREARK
ncbi:MAG: acyl-ACP--UDP-N-acetylglucosamine O-acyltransferase [Verrucomicrobiota bacterium]|nr:acyl-ACP--UDP-N-acetylglucosamine O-acyltransferase [Verrucomicrobiota bacterium]MEC8244589.1 acyl-ACP--UDP-N-acetylglucosamine O-acyltransferase [Verrucomicrobiota bacterium]